MQVEIIVNSLEDLKVVNFFNQKYPEIFTRVELCQDMKKNGLTSDYKVISEISKFKTNLKIFALLRRDESYFFNQKEFENLVKDIQFCKKNKLYGVVIGVITKDFKIDILNLKKLQDLAKPLKVTFHKAFDHVLNYETEILTLKKLKVDYCLTVCDKNEKFLAKNINKLLLLKSIFPNIIIGGGVNFLNLKTILKNNFNFVHLGKCVRKYNSFNHPISFKKMEKLANFFK